MESRRSIVKLGLAGAVASGRASGEPLLFKGQDFALTDIAAA